MANDKTCENYIRPVPSELWGIFCRHCDGWVTLDIDKKIVSVPTFLCRDEALKALEKMIDEAPNCDPELVRLL